ncbi:hypothetical protein [Actinoplanes palleronii]|uniref:hypothetical protein n=1 Tax=Actinoplanes palleronii TaxID=113570 RepID=UPI001945B929|nr:hypothetical protein [Actinoplanes palleronii]
MLTNMIESSLPAEAGTVLDLAPGGAPGSWLTLDDTGRVGRWDIGSGTWRHLATAARQGQLRLHTGPAGPPGTASTSRTSPPASCSPPASRTWTTSTASST